MRFRFENYFRAYTALLVALLLWAIWGRAQTGAVPGTNSLPASAQPAADAALTFRLDRIELLQGQLWGNPLWQYIASLIYILIAFYASKGIDFLTRVWLKKWAARTQTTLDDLLLELLNGPVKIVVFVLFLHVGLQVFAWPFWVNDFLSKGFKIIIAGTLTYLLLKAIDLILEYWKTRPGNDDKTLDAHLFPIIRKSLKALVVTVVVLVTSDNLGLHITGILASVSVVGLALGLAAQDTVANFFGAIVIFVDKPFRLGDRIRLDAVDGTVEAIGLRSTRVRNLDGHLVTIPNKTMGNATITNISRRSNIKTELVLGLTYDTPAEKVKRAVDLLLEIYRSNPMTQDVWVSFNQFADSSLNLQIVHWWKGVEQQVYLAGMQEFNLRIKERFDAEGLSFAFPSRTVYLKTDPDFRGPEAGR